MAFLEYTPKQTLYQFCSLDSFRKLIASRVLWCTDLASANDPRELALGFQHLLDGMKFVRENEYKGHAGEFLERIISEVTSGSGRQQFFCACFSLLKDTLPMWREYGDNYRGVAVGFRPTAITAMPGRIQKVKYLNANIAEGYRQLVRDIASEFDPDHSPSDIVYWVSAATSILAAVTALKHQTWEYEKEIRFVFAQVIANPGSDLRISQFSDDEPIYWEAPLKRQRGDTRIDYKTFQFGRRKQGAHEFSRAIAQVVIGPRCELSVEEAKTELQGNGFESVDVVMSECEIR
jgi:Protein of unknown function (DUF2971)